MITHLLDASAIVAHYFRQPGSEQVNALLTDENAAIGIAAVSLTELKTQLLQDLTPSTPENLASAENAFRLYADELLATLPVTKEVSECAAEILWNSKGRLSPTEAIVAAMAVLESAILVHCNPAFGHLENDGLHLLALSE